LFHSQKWAQRKKREFHFKWISKYKGCGILSFAFKEWMVTFEKRLETSSKKLKIKITKKTKHKRGLEERILRAEKSFFQKNKQFFCVFPQNFLLHLSHCSLNDEKTPPNKYYKQTKQFWWKKRNLDFIKI